MQEPHASAPPTALQSRETEPAAHATVTVAVGSGSGGKAKPGKHRPSAVLKLSQQAMKCLQSYEDKLLLELQSILQNSAASTAASAAAGAAVGAGAAVAAAQQALAGRVALVQSGLLSPPDSARSARAKALQEFRRQPAAGAALGLQAQMVARLEAAEAKLHVHRTAASALVSPAPCTVSSDLSGSSRCLLRPAVLHACMHAAPQRWRHCHPNN